jgi:hypothetical protein
MWCGKQPFRTQSILNTPELKPFVLCRSHPTANGRISTASVIAAG